MSVKTLFTPLADQVRRLTGRTEKLGVNAMTEALSGVSLGVDASGLTAGTTDVIVGKDFIGASGGRETGSMTNNGAVNVTLDAATKTYNVPAGYHNGKGKVGVTTQSKNTVPSLNEHTVYPDENNFLSSVTVYPGAYTGTKNVSAYNMKIDLGFTPKSDDLFFMFIDSEVPFILYDYGGYGNSYRYALFIRRLSADDIKCYDLSAVYSGAPCTNEKPVKVEYTDNGIFVDVAPDGAFRSDDTYRWVLIRK